jgi:superfamily II DNA or RNA helicase
MRCLQQRKKFVMSHPKKIEVARKIIAARQDKKIITFSATIKDAESLKVGYTLHSKKKPKENKVILDKFTKLSCGVLNSSKSLNAGLNIPDINCEIIISGTSSSIDAIQRLGRSCRYQDNKTAEVFVLVLKGTNEDQ